MTDAETADATQPEDFQALSDRPCSKTPLRAA
jgi:hypothetical protein